MVIDDSFYDINFALLAISSKRLSNAVLRYMYMYLNNYLFLSN